MATNLDGITAPVGVDGLAAAMVEWDPDGPGGSLPDALVIGGLFTKINGKGANNVAYLVSSNGTSLSLNTLGGGG